MTYICSDEGVHMKLSGECVATVHCPDGIERKLKSSDVLGCTIDLYPGDIVHFSVEFPNYEIEIRR
jgi:hypothetical protein